MKKIYCTALILLTLWGTESMGQSAFVNQGVIEKMSQADENDLIPVLIQLEDKVDIDALKATFILENTPVDKRPQLVIQALTSRANETQPAILDAIENSGLNHSEMRAYWICNAIELKAAPALIEMLSYREDIAQITLNLPIFGLNKPTERSAAEAKTVGGHEIGLEAIGAPAMWALGYTGHGRMAMTFDTGVQPDHPAHRDRFLVNRLPLESTWFPYDSPVPTDKPGSHGTHVSGIILGLDTLTNDTIGVAPQAYLIATDPIVEDIANVQTLAALMEGYQWALNPDGDIATSEDVPDVINNSWGRSNDIAEAEWQLCSDAVSDVLNAVLAAGISNVFSAGNEGPGEATIGIPHNINTGLVNSFTVAAVSGSGDHVVAEFSSRGPSLCGGEGSILIKPEVSAPGIGVRSSVQQDEYAFFSGTSMAAPHTSGAVLLLKEAFPYLSGEELQLALYYSAIDLGTEGEDNTYGMGLINVHEAFLYLSENNTPVPPQVLENDLALMSIDQPSTDFGCTINGEGEITPVVTIRNTGTNTVDTYSISYGINGGTPGTFGVDQAIAPGEEVQLTLAPVSYTVQGMVEFHVYIDEIDNEYDAWNNHRTIRWQQLNEFDFGSGGTFTENFTSGLDADVWIVQNPDESVTWDVAEVLQIDGTTGTAAWLNHPGYGIIESQKDKLVSPLMTGNSGEQVLTFDYFYRKRSNATFTQDTLTIYLNNDCSPVDIELWQAGGSELWTNDNNQTDALPETPEDWSTVSINLPTEMVDEFYIMFESRNRRGNNLLIDNINISGSNSVADKTIDLGFEIYPNPATENVLIKPNTSLRANEVKVVDISGRIMAEDAMDRTSYNFDISELAPGTYLVYITYENGQQHVEKLIVE